MNQDNDENIQVPMLTVDVAPFDQSCGNLRMEDNGPEIWNWCVSNQFPISETISKSENVTVLGVGYPHQGYSIHAHMKDGKLDGDATIQTPNNVVIAKIQYSEGKLTGPCELYYQSGTIFFKGYLENGYRHGRGKEYDEQGSVIFDGYYDKGNKLRMDPFTEMGEGYWKVLDEKNQLRNVFRFVDPDQHNEICYFYDCGKISRVSECIDGNEVKVLKEFKGDETMIEYENGVKVYEGGFLDSLEQNYPRNGAGTEYDADGQSILFKGMYKDNVRHGMGTCYKNGEPSSTGKTEWIMGRSLQNTLIVQILKIVILVVLLITCLTINLILGISFSVLAILFLLIRWKCPKYLGSKISDFTDYEKIAQVITENDSKEYNRTHKSCKSKMKKTGVFLLKNIYVSTIIVIVIIMTICTIIYKLLVPYNGSPHGIGYYSETYEVKDGSENRLLRFILSKYPNLKFVDIGNNCFGNVRLFRIDGLNRLKTLQIGKYSFTQTKDKRGNDPSKSFHILSCKSLKSIQIGEYSFSDFGGDFELKNLPQLRLIKIGSVNIVSDNFYYRSLVIRGIDTMLKK